MKFRPGSAECFLWTDFCCAVVSYENDVGYFQIFSLREGSVDAKSNMTPTAALRGRKYIFFVYMDDSNGQLLAGAVIKIEA